MSKWMCSPDELHVLKDNDVNTDNLRWVRVGLLPNGKIKWEPACRACEENARREQAKAAMSNPS